MLQTSGAIQVNTPIKSISAVKPSRGSGQTRAKNKRGGENVRWKRITQGIDAAIEQLRKCPPDRFDELVSLVAANARLATPVTRLVYFKHLTPAQGMAARRYADIVRRFERYHVDKASRTARSQSFEPSRGGEDQELERLANSANLDAIADYEREARNARKAYDKAQKVLARYGDSVSGRNEAKNIVDDLCLSDIEPPAQYRKNVAAVLEALAAAFG